MPDSTLSRRSAALWSRARGHRCFLRRINFTRKLQKNHSIDPVPVKDSAGDGIRRRFFHRLQTCRNVRLHSVPSRKLKSELSGCTSSLL